MTFQAVYIFKGSDNEVLGQISFDSKTYKWFFMPQGLPLFLEDIEKLHVKLDGLNEKTQTDKPSMFDMFKRNKEV